VSKEWRKISEFDTSIYESSPCLVASRQHRIPVVAQYAHDWWRGDGWYKIDADDCEPLTFEPDFWQWCPILDKEQN